MSVRNLPCITEIWKTLDGENLVKSLDIGQVSTFRVFAIARVLTLALASAKMIVVREEDTEAPPPGESRDGIAPVMTDARNRHFRKLPEVNPAVVERVETELIQIVNSGAPKGWTFEDIEEEYVEGTDGSEGYWKVIGHNQY